MELTIAEALRLKKEISQKVGQLMSSINRFGDDSLSFGEILEDEKVTSETDVALPDFLSELETAFRASEAINDVLGRTNSEVGISSLVRARENAKVLLSVLTKAITKSKPKVTTSWEVVGDERKEVKLEFRPFMSVKDLRTRVKEVRKEIRDLQSKIDDLNTKTIEVNISEEDLDSLDL